MKRALLAEEFSRRPGFDRVMLRAGQHYHVGVPKSRFAKVLRDHLDLR
jgi:hypothetical protein